MQAQISLSLLGSPTLARDGNPVPITRNKAIALVAYLALTKQRHDRNEIALLLWPDADARRRLGSLRSALWDLNRALGDGWLDTDRGHVELLRKEGVFIDVMRFEQLCRPHLGMMITSAEQRVAWLQAVSLYRGDFLAGIDLSDCPEYMEWRSARSEHFRRLLTETLHRLVQSFMADNLYSEALPFARRLVTLEPLDEQACVQLMRIQAQLGRVKEALKQYEITAAALKNAVGVRPSDELRALHASLRKGDSPVQSAPSKRKPGGQVDAGREQLPSSPPSRRSDRERLPVPPNVFVGRQRELALLDQMLDTPMSRLFTVMGPGGVGKTRLALEVAHRRAGRYRDGCCFLSLAHLQDDTEESVAFVIADTLGLPPFEDDAAPARLLAYLREQNILLVLDGVEHLRHAATLFTRIAAEAVAVQLLITSRERLCLRGESVLVVGGLSCDEAELDPQERWDARELFIALARRACPTFSLSAPSERTIERICRRLEGMPLAIELAATWTSRLSLEEIAAEIERDLDFLAGLRGGPERHQSIRATFQHSYRLLSADEQAALRRLAVFRGSFTSEAALEVASASLPLLSRLESKSLLRHTGTKRHALHGSVRHYAAALLAANPEEHREAHERHAGYHADWLEKLGHALGGPSRTAVLDVLSLDIDGAREAFRWASEHGQLSTLARMIDGFCIAEESLGHFHAADSALDAAAPVLRRSATSSDATTTRLLGRLLTWQARFALDLGEQQRAAALLDEATSVLREGGSRAALADALVQAGRLSLGQGNLEAARLSFEASLELARASGLRPSAATALGHLSTVAFRQGDSAAAKQLLERSFAIFRAFEDHHRMATCLSSLAEILLFEGDYASAEGTLREGLSAARAAEAVYVYATLEVQLAHALRGRGALDEATERIEGVLRTAHSLGHGTTIAAALHELGEIARLRGDLASATDFCRESFSLYQRRNARRGMAEAQRSLGAAMLAQGDAGAARACFDQALRTAMEIDDVPLVLDLLVHMADLRGSTPNEPIERALQVIAVHPAARASTRRRVIQSWPQDMTGRAMAESSLELPALITRILGAL